MDQLHILVVDDNHINRLYLKTILTQWQHHVTEVDSGEGALSTCQQQPFDLILMDIRMQPMDGVTAAARIKQLSQHRETPIIAVSAEQIDCTSHPQFCQCIVKPLHKTALKNLIEQQASRNCQQQPASLFDENMALAISHQDTEIVKKLRTLFIKELPAEINKIEQFHHAQLWQELDNQLHHLQGSARICAAVKLNHQIKYYREQIADKCFKDIDGCLQNLQKAATDILHSNQQQAS